jgi:hypothetical protein
LIEQRRNRKTAVVKGAVRCNARAAFLLCGAAAFRRLKRAWP